jgi:hypothetical protein
MKNQFFRFEDDFIEAGVRCIPMIVRFKLDACGIKLKLKEWSMMTPEERTCLADSPCRTETEVLKYRDRLYELVVQRTGDVPTLIPVEKDPAWARIDEIPSAIKEKLEGLRITCSPAQWQALSDLQRFALLKLSYSGHEHKNFSRALAEFGICSVVLHK